ncbi:MAG: AsmA family protein, partial [Gammaproteobacteria bacterium]
MTSRKYFFSTLKGLVTFIATLGLIFVMLSFMNLSISLDSGHRVFTEHVKSLTGRDAHIDGEIKLTVSLTPRLLVQRIHISNPDGIDNEYFITVSEAQVAVSLIPLLSGQLHFSDITAEHAKINLTKKEDGSNNWSFDAFTQPSIPAKTKTADDDSWKSGMGRLSLGALKLTNVAIVYSDESRNQVIESQIDQLIIDLKNITKPLAEISGSIQGQPYTITFESDALEIFAAGGPWQLHGTGHIAGSKAELEANLEFNENEIDSVAHIELNYINLGLLLEKLGIISGQHAATEQVSIKAKIRGSDLAELFEQT